jgi:hypothetical protein
VNARLAEIHDMHVGAEAGGVGEVPAGMGGLADGERVRCEERFNSG